VVENLLLANQLAEHQEFVIPVSSCGQKAGTASDQGINTAKIPIKMAELLLDRSSNLADGRALLLCHCQKLLTGFLSMRTWLLAKRSSDRRMHRVNQFFCNFSGFVEQG